MVEQLQRIPVETKQTPLERVNSKLNLVTHNDVRDLLDEKQRDGLDPKAGIVIVELPLKRIEGPQGQTYHLWAGRILPGGFVNPHLHEIGEEPYKYLTGDGEMNTGYVINGNVVWGRIEATPHGQIRIVKEAEIHCLRNVGREPLDFVFSAPPNHWVDRKSLEDRSGDRFFVMGLPNGKPHFLRKAA